jgi:hypothetical protein
MNITFNPTPEDDTAAAIVAALAAALAEDAAPAEGSAGQQRSLWSAAGQFAAQGLPPARSAAHAAWAAAERAERERRWSYGIVGM